MARGTARATGAAQRHAGGGRGRRPLHGSSARQVLAPRQQLGGSPRPAAAAAHHPCNTRRTAAAGPRCTTPLAQTAAQGPQTQSGSRCRWAACWAGTTGPWGGRPGAAARLRGRRSRRGTRQLAAVRLAGAKRQRRGATTGLESRRLPGAAPGCPQLPRPAHPAARPPPPGCARAGCRRGSSRRPRCRHRSLQG